MFYGNGIRNVKREGCASSSVTTKKLTQEQLKELNRKYPKPKNVKIPLILTDVGSWTHKRIRREEPNGINKITKFYVSIAISGTGQENVREINIHDVAEYLEKYAKIAAGSEWETWLVDAGLGTVKEIKKAVQAI